MTAPIPVRKDWPLLMRSHTIPPNPASPNGHLEVQKALSRFISNITYIPQHSDCHRVSNILSTLLKLDTY